MKCSFIQIIDGSLKQFDFDMLEPENVTHYVNVSHKCKMDETNILWPESSQTMESKTGI